MPAKAQSGWTHSTQGASFLAHTAHPEIGVLADPSHEWLRTNPILRAWGEQSTIAQITSKNESITASAPVLFGFCTTMSAAVLVTNTGWTHNSPDDAQGHQMNTCMSCLIGKRRPTVTLRLRHLFCKIRQKSCNSKSFFTVWIHHLSYLHHHVHPHLARPIRLNLFLCVLQDSISILSSQMQ